MTIPENDSHEALTFVPVEIPNPDAVIPAREWKFDDKPGETLKFRRAYPKFVDGKLECGEFPSPPSSKPTNPKDMVGARKAPFSTVPSTVMAEVGVAMLEGMCKYGRHNYRVAGVRGSVYYDATMRHLTAWWEGQDIDPDSGLPHIVKAIASLVVLRDATIQDRFTDDRPPSSAPFFDALNKLAAEIIDRHADKNPRHYTIADTEMKI